MRNVFPWLALLGATVACGDNIRPATDANGGDDAATGDASVDANLQCTPNTTTCDGDNVVVCDAEGNGTATECVAGCDDTQTPPRCRIPVISNLPPTTCETPGTEDLVVAAAASVTINTMAANCDALLPQGGMNNPMICVKIYNNVDIAATGTVVGTGPNALAIVATGTMSVAGTIDVSANTSAAGVVTNGPGAVLAGNTVGGSGAMAQSGGGGGGYGTNGAAGASGASPTGGGTPGLMGGMATIIPLRGGALGGEGGMQQAGRAAAGGGGGALLLGSCTSINIAMTAVIDAGGSGGEGGLGSLNATIAPGGGAGGGAGGSILIEAPSVTVAGGVFANGGAGGSGGARGVGTPPNATPGAKGDNGGDANRSTMPAMGGTPVLLNGGGGNGGAGATAPTSGDTPNVGTESAGGGGGAVGRIRINARMGTTPTVTGELSPMATQGEMATQ